MWNLPYLKIMFWSVPNETLCAYGCICVPLHLRQLQVPRNCMSRSLLLNPSVPCCMCASCRMRRFSLFPQIFSERTFFSYVSINFVLKNSVSQRVPQKSDLDLYKKIPNTYDFLLQHSTKKCREPAYLAREIM